MKKAERKGQIPAVSTHDIETIGIVRMDRQGRILELNRKAADILASAPEWLVNRPFLVFVASHDVARFLQSLLTSARSHERMKGEFDLFVDNRLLPVRISLTSIQGDEGMHTLEVIEVSELRAAQNELQGSLAQWRSLVLNAADTIMTLDRDGKITFINGPIWGYSVHALLGTRIYDYVPKRVRTRLQHCLQVVFENGKRAVCEVNGRNGAGQSWYSISFGPGQSRQVYGTTTPTTTTTTTVIRDITAQKRTEGMLRASGEQLRNLTARLEAVREEERNRVAREIHDDLGQAMTILKFDLSWIERNLGSRRADVGRKLKEVISQVDNTIDRVRTIASELRPSVLDDAGLVAAVEWQAEQFEKRTGIPVHFQTECSGLDELPVESSVVAFRVVQEALTNILRHAEASRVDIRLKETGDSLHISVLDDGKGMAAADISAPSSLGIAGMKERLSRLGGEFRVLSSPGKGTRLEIIVPIHPARSGITEIIHRSAK